MAFGGGVSYHGIELRKLPPRFRLHLSQILNVDNSWKRLMASIPSEKNTSIPKYKPEHIDLIENHSLTSRKLPMEILLDEWPTSGRIRPTTDTLYVLLQECQLYRAADYVATEILMIPQPLRPSDGPAKSIPVPVPDSQNLLDTRIDSNLNSTKVLTFSGDSPSAIHSVLQQLNNYDYTKGNPVHFDIAIIEIATNNFQNPIGSGAFGSVFALDLKPKGPKLAVKLLNPSSTLIEEQFVTEIRVLSQYRHENIVPLVGFCTNAPQYCLIYEFMSGGTLLQALQSRDNPLSWSCRIEIQQGIIRGIDYLHTAKDRPLIHRDIKSANVLLHTNPNDGYGRLHPKIGDFGLAKSFSNSNQTSVLTSTIFGTGLYMAPEAFRGDISTKMDVYSFGVILLELLTGLPPFDEDREEGLDIVTYIEEVVKDEDIQPWLDENAGNIDPEIPIRIYEISLKCLAEKRRRPTAAQVLNQLLQVPSPFNRL